MLAKEEYEDFPVIQDEIVEAGKDVKRGSELLSDATRLLESGRDIGAGWDRVGHAVAQMAERTSLLLHIVYGAEIKRIFACAAETGAGVEQLAAAAKQLKPDDDHAPFVETVKREAQKMKELADQLATRAAQEENPETKKQLQEIAQALIDKNNDVLRAVNAFVQKPDEENKKKLLKAIEDLARVTEKLKPRGPDTIDSLIPKVKKAVDDVADAKKRGWKPGKGRDFPDAPPAKEYKFRRPVQWDPEEEEQMKWPRLRHVEPNEKNPADPHRPAWADVKLKPSGGDGQPGSPRSPGGSNPSSPRQGAPPVSPGRGPNTYQRGAKDGPGDTSPRRGWKPGTAGPQPDGPGDGKHYRVVPPKQLPFPPEDPPMAWPVLRKTDGPQSSTFPEQDFPWKNVKPWMPQEEATNAISRIYHDVVALPTSQNPSDVLKNIEKQLDKLDTLAPLLGKSSNNTVKQDADAIRNFLKKLNPKSVPADTADKLNPHLRRVLRQATPTDPEADMSTLKFKDPNFLPPPEAEPPFPWPKLRNWVCESVATAADEFEDTLRDWERIRKEKGDENPPKQHLREGLEVLHDVLAPRMGLDSAKVLRDAAKAAWKELDNKVVDLDAVRRHLKPVLAEANLSDEDLKSLRARNALRGSNNPVGELHAVLARVREALDRSIPPPANGEEKVAAEALALRSDVSRTRDLLPSAERNTYAPSIHERIGALKDAAAGMKAPTSRDIVLEKIAVLEQKLKKDLLPRTETTGNLAAAEVKKGQDAANECIELLDSIVGLSGCPSNRANHFRTTGKVQQLIDDILRLASSADNNGSTLLETSKRLCDMLSELSALLRLEGASGAEAAEIVRRLLEQLGNKASVPPGGVSPRRHAARGFDKVSSNAEEIVGLKLPAPQKGQKLLTEESAIVTDTRKVGDALKKYAAAAKSGNGELLIGCAKDVQALCKPLLAQVNKLITLAKDKDTLDRLHSIRRALGTYPMQIKILSSVKATSSAADFDKNDQLVSMVEALSSGVLDVIPAANVVILSQ